VKKDKVIGQGYHEKYGELHAERNALANCSESPQGATLYVTLEPCCHFGKTPPCTQAIIESGIKKVVVACGDPNPFVAGKGLQILREHGITVVTNVLETECSKLNEVFFHYIKTGTPYVVMKYAMTADGKIATYTGASKWITGEEARQRVHQDRHRYQAIMVGIGTVIADNPMLNCRLENGIHPLRIVCDTTLKTPLESQLVTTATDIPTILATANTDQAKQNLYKDKNCDIITVDKKDGHLDLNQLMRSLAARKIDSILLEGGSTLNWSALQGGIVNKVQTYIAPKIFGGNKAKAPVGGEGVELPNDAFSLANQGITMLGEDVLIEYEVVKKCSQV
jgi:diaminohydroxyphosphoribosylaminopyrimidine deaminase/5-amino-6-(5-phosphoribosylamino)uracil reductase